MKLVIAIWNADALDIIIIIIINTVQKGFSEIFSEPKDFEIQDHKLLCLSKKRLGPGLLEGLKVEWNKRCHRNLGIKHLSDLFWGYGTREKY